MGKLEELERIFGDSHICEIKKRFSEIECASDKCDVCPLGIGDGICLKNTFEHKWKYQHDWNDALERINELEKEKSRILEGVKEIIELSNMEIYDNNLVGFCSDTVKAKDFQIEKLQELMRIIKEVK